MERSGFQVIPAIDLQGGHLARMPRGDPAAVHHLPGEPVEVARGLVEAGARWLHVVDLDAAVGGRPRNLEILAAIAALPVRVQAGGSLSPDAAEAALESGADRAVLGAAILSDRGALRTAVERFGDRAGVAVDVRDGRIAPRGGHAAGPALEEALNSVAAARPAFVTFTDVGRDGSMAGPDLRMMAVVAERVPCPVYASGGVAIVDDLLALAAVRPALAGAIVGRALQDGAFTLAEAEAVLDRGSTGG
jgi:phosphoribosylformimino-5-aminoimidazole carboxamide ribonucleotide (ProFAR) isomerase